MKKFVAFLLLALFTFVAGNTYAGVDTGPEKSQVVKIDLVSVEDIHIEFEALAVLAPVYEFPVTVGTEISGVAEARANSPPTTIERPSCKINPNSLCRRLR